MLLNQQRVKKSIAILVAALDAVVQPSVHVEVAGDQLVLHAIDANGKEFDSVVVSR